MQHGQSRSTILSNSLFTVITELQSQGIDAHAFPGDLSSAAAVKDTLAAVQQSLGHITVLHWNAYGGRADKDVLDLTTEDLNEALAPTVHGMY